MVAVMNSLKTEESCVENKQSVAASGSYISEGNGGFFRMSPASSPATSLHTKRMSGPIRRAKGGWTPEEDETLRRSVELHMGRNWKKIAESIPDRTEVQCLHRWQKVLDPKLIKGQWTPKEDDTIISLVAEYGPTKWSLIARSLPGRIGKQCRERWHNHLNPEIRRDAWTPMEEMELMKAHLKHGNKWAEIAKVLNGRSDNSIKNHWNSSLKKRSESYFRTGELPPAHKPGIHHTVKDTTNSTSRKLFYCSNKESDTSAEIVPESCSTAHSSLPTETLKVGQMDWAVPISALASDLNASLDIAVRLSDSSDGSECQSQASKDLVTNRSELGVKLEACSSDGEVCQNEEPFGTIIDSVPDNLGCLCYKPPLFEDIGIYASSLLFGHNSMQPASVPEMVSPPISYSGWPSVESILKSAAKSFPSTPSIIKKRTEAHTPPDTTHISKTRIQDICTPKERKVDDNSEGLAFSVSKLFSSPYIINGDLLDNGKEFNFSPPYCLRSKRKATLKSVEKQLDFTLKDANLDENSKYSTFVINRSSSTPVLVLSMHGKKLKDNPAGVK